jgi:molybdate transport system substrate-binding protein
MPGWIVLAALVAACQPAVPEGQGAAGDEPHRLKVVTSGGFAAAYDILAPRFEAETGIELVTANGASSGGAPDSIPVRLERGEEFDVVILSRPSLDNLTELGFVRAESRRDLVRSSIGMAVRKGAQVPDIGTPESFVHALLEAESIGYSASASGTYLSTVLFPRLGLAAALESKSKRILSERVASVVARGEVEIGFQQISEILPIEGIHFVGPIPDEYQSVTTFSIGITTRSDDVSGAQQLVDFLSSRKAAATIESTGLEPVSAP